MQRDISISGVANALAIAIAGGRDVLFVFCVLVLCFCLFGVCMLCAWRVCMRVVLALCVLCVMCVVCLEFVVCVV